MKISVSQSTLSDLEGIKAYSAEEGVHQIAHIQSLADNPDIGRIVPEFDEPKIRELIHAPFRIVYLREQTSIHVIRVWRSERLLRLPEDEHSRQQIKQDS